MSSYSKESIIRTRFPSWCPNADGTWSRTWRLELEQTPTNEVGAEYDLSDPHQSVLVRIGSGRGVTLTTTTREDPLSDELFFFAAYRALVAVDSRIGKIATIEGLPRSAYQPFRSAGGNDEQGEQE